MKALIVEDDSNKKDNIIRLLKQYNITEYYVEKFVSKAIQLASNTEFDILITDLGIARFVDHPVVEDPKEGLKMMYDLAYSNIRIPTIIYSTTKINNDQIEYLKEIEYPFLGQVESIEVLEEKLKEFMEAKK